MGHVDDPLCKQHGHAAEANGSLLVSIFKTNTTIPNEHMFHLKVVAVSVVLERESFIVIVCPSLGTNRNLDVCTR